VEDIIDIIAKSEKRLRARKANEVPVFKSAVGLIIGDLLIGFHTRDAGWPCLSMSTSAFSDRPVGYKTFKPIVETLEALGLIKVSLGRNSKNIKFDQSDKVTYSPGFATRFKPRGESLSLLDSGSRVCHRNLHALSESLIAINRVFKGDHTLLFYVDSSSGLTNFRQTLITVNY
jgi:hypothetical protein